MQFISNSRGSYLGLVDLLEETGMAFVALTSGIRKIESIDHSKEGYSGQNGDYFLDEDTFVCSITSTKSKFYKKVQRSTV